MQARLPLYRDLLKVTEKTVGQAERVAEQLGKVEVVDFMQALKAQGLDRPQLRRLWVRAVCDWPRCLTAEHCETSDCVRKCLPGSVVHGHGWPVRRKRNGR